MHRTAIASAAALIAAFTATPTPGHAGEPVDPATLTPPPPQEADCHLSGGRTICHTVFVADYANEPIFDLPCGTVYESMHQDRFGVRWYDEDGRLTTRFVSAHDEGTWSLSPTGDGPAVKVVSQGNWRNDNIDADAPEPTWPMTSHGVGIRLSAPGHGVILQIAGMVTPEGTHHGVGSEALFEDPEVHEALCAALGA